MTIIELKSDTLNKWFCETWTALVCRSKWTLYHRKTEGCSFTDKYMDVLSQMHRWMFCCRQVGVCSIIER